MWLGNEWIHLLYIQPFVNWQKDSSLAVITQQDYEKENFKLK